MSTECTARCDYCGRKVADETGLWPLVVTDQLGGSKDVCREECLLLLAFSIAQNRSWREGRVVGEQLQPEPQIWWKRWGR
ncbi:hypothetical protein J2X46_002719 [Nocardioides sp. BE266]|nr:hypothetical protein [Nocardioides sp. BE266]